MSAEETHDFNAGVIILRLDQMEAHMETQAKAMSETRATLDNLTLKMALLDQKLSSMQQPGRSDMCANHLVMLQACNTRIDVVSKDTRENTKDIQAINRKILIASTVLLTLNTLIMVYGPHISAFLHTTAKIP